MKFLVNVMCNQLPQECQWVVWVDPPPPLRVALAFEGLHAEVEQSWIKGHKLKKENLEMSRKNLVLNKKLRGRDEMMLILALLFVGICVVLLFVL